MQSLPVLVNLSLPIFLILLIYLIIFLPQTTLSDIIPDILPALASKNPQVKEGALKFLGRCLANATTPIPPAQMKSVTEPLAALLEDGFEGARAEAATCLGTLMKMVGERPLNALMEGLADVRKAKVKEAYETATVQCKASVGVPPKAASGNKEAAGKKKAPAVKKNDTADDDGPPPKKPSTKPPAKSAVSVFSLDKLLKDPTPFCSRAKNRLLLDQLLRSQRVVRPRSLQKLQLPHLPARWIPLNLSTLRKTPRCWLRISYLNPFLLTSGMLIGRQG
jgi:hypothetical protein